ncbi:SIMPL domain-containing protein [uncultured Paracoccus sp.]|uniref:SIMPL domain-containing protein n=1 Tax=uncultured Paracoccus sp. TaxID=189685 RepID=UPI0025D95D14|nr:SIMPL domain-containing protein [uncultured Paracoccus sp.]
MTQFPRRLTRIALVASTALALATPAMAAPGKGGHGMCHPGMSRLTVTGQGEARVAPDLATIQMGVTTQAASAADAMRQNSQQQTAVIEALTGAGVETADVQTSGLNLTPMMDYGEGRAPTVTGYQASNMVSVRIKDVARLGEVLDAIVAAGANEINGINFIRDDSSATEDEARRDAVADARHKAEILAEAAGLTLGPVLVLRDAPMPEGPRPMMMEARAAADAANVPIAAGEVALSAMVEMQFALSGQDCGPMGGQRGDHGHDQGDLPPGHPPVPGMQPAPAEDGAAAPAPGDVPPPLGTDTGAPAPGEPVVPMGETPPPAN